jgi:hypothetical protein
MNCPEARDQLAALIYGDLPPGEAARVEQHLTTCPACRHAGESLRRVGAALDTVPVPPVEINLLRLYQEATRRQVRRARRWRWAGLAGCAAAAAAFLVLGLRLEVRIEAQQLVLRWGSAPLESTQVRPEPPTPPANRKAEPDSLPDRYERLQVLSDIVHALVEDSQARDKMHQQQLLRIQARLDQLQLQDNARWRDARLLVATLIASQSGEPKKGDQP